MQRSIEGIPIFISGVWILFEDLIAPAEVRKDMMSCQSRGLVRDNRHAGWAVAYGLPERQKDNKFDS